jgi:hypothetical protein
MATGQVKLFNQKGGYGVLKADDRTSAVTLYSFAPRHALSHPALGIESGIACASIQKTGSGRRSRSRRRPRQWRDCLSVLESFPGWGRAARALPNIGRVRPGPLMGPQGHTPGSGDPVSNWLQWECPPGP